MPNCLAGCAEEYNCQPLMTPGPAGEQAESFAPWVWVSIGGSEQITVGNESHPADPHTACIKAYEIGWVDMPNLTVEILDEAGGRMGALVDSVRKCVTAGNGTGTEMISQFGWIIATCEGQKRKISSPKIKSQIINLEVNYSEGKIKYRIECRALAPIYEDMREDNTKGEDDKKITIEEAIRNIAALPPAMRVRYCAVEDGQLKDVKFKWKNFGEGGPKGTWQGDNQNRMATITKWLEPFRVDDGTPWGKGISPRFKSTTYDELILLVDPTPNPGEARTCGANHLGTFIVNGGKCSPVIEFTPTFNWIKGVANFSAGGGTSGPANTNSNFEEDKKTDEQEKDHGSTAGLQQQVTISQQSWDAYGPKNAYKETMRSQQAHAKASRLTDIEVQPITADLRILGDPREPFHTGAGEKFCSVVAINPFHIQGGGNSGCGDWLAMPACNQILSNKMWMIQGINHSIKEGSYTTTLKLYLASPGIDQGKKEELGGSGSNGATVKNTC